MTKQKENERQPLASLGQTESRSRSPMPTTQIAGETSEPVPQIPYTWECGVESSSSFEKALDFVIEKLDAMEERRQYARNLNHEAPRKTTTEQASLKVVSTEDSKSKPTSRSGPRSGAHFQEKPLAPKAEAASETEDSVDYLENDIKDRDVLLGLRMAICAACDEDLDAWIREKTGLRLRRFLADLKAFDAVSKSSKPSASIPQPLHRQIRRNRNEERRLKAEQDRRRQSMKKTLLPCCGADSPLAKTGYDT